MWPPFEIRLFNRATSLPLNFLLPVIHPYLRYDQLQIILPSEPPPA